MFLGYHTLIQIVECCSVSDLFDSPGLLKVLFSCFTCFKVLHMVSDCSVWL